MRSDERPMWTVIYQEFIMNHQYTKAISHLYVVDPGEEMSSWCNDFFLSHQIAHSETKRVCESVKSLHYVTGWVKYLFKCMKREISLLDVAVDKDIMRELRLCFRSCDGHDLAATCQEGNHGV